MSVGPANAGTSWRQRPAAAAPRSVPVRRRFWAFVAFFVLVTASAVAQETGRASAENPTSVQAPAAVMTEVREAVSSLAEELDEFLSDSEYELEQNRTRLTLKFVTDMTRDGMDFQVDPTLSLRLPLTERTVLLEISGGTLSEDPGRAAGVVSAGREGTDNEVERLKLRLASDFGAVGIFPSVGLRFNGGKPWAYAGLRLRVSRAVSETLRLLASQSVLMHSRKEVESRLLLRGDWQLDRRSLLRGQMRLDWRRDTDSLRFEPALIYRRQLDDSTALSFETSLQAFARSDTTPNTLHMSIRARRLLFQDWIIGEVQPWVSATPRRPRMPEYGLRIGLEYRF